MQKQQSECLDAAEMIFQLRPAAVSEFMHCLRNPQTFFSAKFSLKMGPTTLFIHLKIILLQCFQFSVFNNKWCGDDRPKNVYWAVGLV